ncbi:MAG: DUF3307 domain-containing protein [Chloroflexota bacterium]
MVTSLFLSHLVGDYILQWDSLARWKARELRGVLVHGAVVQATTLLFTLPFNPDWWPWALFVGVTHALIDTVPLSIGKHVHPFLWFVLDQAAHFVIIVIALTASGYLGASTLVSDLILALTSNRVWAFTLSYTFLTMPALVVVEFVVYALVKGSGPDFAEVPDKYLGSLERGLITTLVLLGQFTLVPLVALPRLVFDSPQAMNGQRATLYVAELLTSIGLAVMIGLGLRLV